MDVRLSVAGDRGRRSWLTWVLCSRTAARFELGWEHEADGLGPWEWCGHALEEFDILMQIGYDVTNVAEPRPTNPPHPGKLDADAR